MPTAKYSTSQAHFQYIFLRDYKGESGGERNWERWGKAGKGGRLRTGDCVCCSGALPPSHSRWLSCCFLLSSTEAEQAVTGADWALRTISPPPPPGHRTFSKPSNFDHRQGEAGGEDGGNIFVRVSERKEGERMAETSTTNSKVIFFSSFKSPVALPTQTTSKQCWEQLAHNRRRSWI